MFSRLQSSINPPITGMQTRCSGCCRALVNLNLTNKTSSPPPLFQRGRLERLLKEIEASLNFNLTSTILTWDQEETKECQLPLTPYRFVGRYLPTFRRNILCPSSLLKMETSRIRSRSVNHSTTNQALRAIEINWFLYILYDVDMITASVVLFKIPLSFVCSQKEWGRGGLLCRFMQRPIIV
jgi:hypothetical protein